MSLITTALFCTVYVVTLVTERDPVDDPKTLYPF